MWLSRGAKHKAAPPYSNVLVLGPSWKTNSSDDSFRSDFLVRVTEPPKSSNLFHIALRNRAARSPMPVPMPCNPKALRDPQRIDEVLLFRLSKIVSLGGGFVTRLCEGRYGITRREWAVLAILGTQRRLQWAELGQRSELDDARLSRAVSSLASKGFATKASDSNRYVHVSLTETGLVLYAEIFPQTLEVNARLLDGLDDQSIEVLDHALRLIHDHADRLVKEAELPKADRRLGRHR